MPYERFEDIDPEEAQRQKRFKDRVEKLRRELEHTSLVRFTVGDLPALSRIMGFATNSAGEINPTQKDLARIESNLFPPED